MLFNPGDVAVHPRLQEFFAARTDAAVVVEQVVLGLDKCFRLTQRRHIEIRQGIAQMLLRQGGSGRAERYAQHAGRFAGKRPLTVGARSIVYRVLDREVLVLIIADGRRDMRALLARRLLGA